MFVFVALAGFGCAASEPDTSGEPTRPGDGPERPGQRPDATATVDDAGEVAPGDDATADSGRADRPVWLEHLPDHRERLPEFRSEPRPAEARGGAHGERAGESPEAEDGPQAIAVEPRIPADPRTNPAIATIDGYELTAADFVSRLFHMHYDWYLHFVRELYVDRVAQLEAEREGIHFSNELIETSFRRLVEFYQSHARRIGQSWRLHWQGLGYASEEDYLEHLRSYVGRLMLLDRLIKLLDMRLTKVDFSQIVIPAAADRYVPDPRGRAQELAEGLRAGRLNWNHVVRTHSRDWQSEDGRQGRVPRGFLGVTAMDEFLFSAEVGDISDPISHPMYGWVILKVNAVHEGRPAVTYEEARDEIEATFADLVPGSIQGRDTFLWLEQILLSDRYRVRTFGPLDPQGRPWIATILDEPVTARELLHHASQTKPDWTRQVITETIVFHLAGLEAKREGIEPEQAEVRAAAAETLRHLKEATAERGQDFERIWRRRGYTTEADFRRSVIEPRVRESMHLERLIFLHDRRIERREIWHILCQSRALAERAKEMVSSDRRDFADAARMFSQHRPTRERGGLIGLVPKDMFSADFSDVAFSLSPGEVSEPVETANGFHVLKITRIEPARPNLTWREARREIEAAIAKVPGMPGDRVPISDTYRWIDAVQATGRYDIATHVTLGPQAARELLGRE